MPYLIDGNNVMALTPGWHRDLEAARRRLIRELAQFIAVHRVKVRVVFDGAADDEFPEGRRYKSVTVSYAKPGSDADTRIKDIVRRASFKRDLVVVTSDRNLAAFAKGQGARVLPSHDFRGILEQSSLAEGGITGEHATVNVDEWLNYFSKKPQ